MEILFLVLLLVLMATALGSGFPVAFSLPGAAILTIGAAALCGWLFVGDVDAYFAQGGPTQWLNAGVTNFRGIYWEVERDTLIAIPLFVFMGIMLQRSRIAEDLLVTMAQLFGPMPGGLGISVVFVGALLAATTGIVGATVVAMGLISLPAMMRNGYANPLSTGTIAASGTLGQIIPPSIVLIILADQLASATDQASTARKTLYKAATGEISMPSELDVVSTSAGDMFMGAFVPGLVLVGLYMLFILVVALARPRLAPAVPFEGRYDRSFALRVLVILVPPLTLIFIVLGSIIAGVATVNQAGAIGAAGATVMAGYRLWADRPRAFAPSLLGVVAVLVLAAVTLVHPINVKSLHTGADFVALGIASLGTLMLVAALAWSGWRTLVVDDTLRGVMVETAKTSSLVFIILLGAAMLTAAFRAFGGEELVRDFLGRLPGGFWAQFVIVMLVIFVLGFFLDFIEIAVVVVPIVAPILLSDPSANVTAVWLGVMIGLNIQTSFLTPPFGFALFYLRGVAPAAVKTLQMYKGVVPFIVLQLVALVIVGLNPPLVNYLPSRISLTSETAPPPMNPRLQHCIEEVVLPRYRTREAELRAAIEAARSLDLDLLPPDLARSVREALARAERTWELVRRIEEAHAAVQAKADAYRPLHAKVRFIEHRLRRLEVDLARIRQRLDQMRGNPEGEETSKMELERREAELLARIERLRAEIPPEWEEAHKAFSKLEKAELQARRAYRRNADEAYTAIRDLIEVLAATDALAALEPRLVALAEQLESKERISPEEAGPLMEALARLSRDMGAVPRTGRITSRLSRARRALRGDEPDLERARKALAQALERYRQELAWRQKARPLLPGLRAYEAAIRETIGLRQQPRIPEALALELAKCTSVHRDISLRF